MVVRGTIDADEQYEDLPADFLEMKNVDVAPSSGGPLEFLPSQAMDNLRYSNDTSGVPKFYTIHGTEIEWYPTPQTETEIRIGYYGKIPSLSDGQTTNWLLTSSPDLYMAASLTEAYAYLFDPESATLWNAKASQIIASMNTEADRAEYSGSPLKMRARSF